MASTTPELHVVVVGAGMAGLGTALAVRKAGHQVTVLEQAPEFGEVIKHNMNILKKFSTELTWPSFSDRCWSSSSTERCSRTDQMGLGREDGEDRLKAI